MSPGIAFTDVTAFCSGPAPMPTDSGSPSCALLVTSTIAAVMLCRRFSIVLLTSASLTDVATEVTPNGTPALSPVTPDGNTTCSTISYELPGASGPVSATALPFVSSNWVCPSDCRMRIKVPCGNVEATVVISNESVVLPRFQTVFLNVTVFPACRFGTKH